MVVIQCRGMAFSGVKAVLFDKDGTLEDSAEFLRQLGLRRSRLVDAQVPGVGEPLLMAFGIDGDFLNPAGLMAVGSRLENQIAAAAYIAETGRDWLESKSMASRAFDEADAALKLVSPPPLYPGVRELVQALASAGLKVGILSADTQARVEMFVKTHQLDPYVQLAMGAGDRPPKPDPRLFQQACEALGVAPGATIMVGDSAGDIIMARQAGAVGCIGICWGDTQAVHLEPAEVTIARLDEIQVLH